MAAIQKMLDKLKQLEESATPGPWHTVESPWRPNEGATWVIAGSADPHCGTAICEPMEVLEWEEGEEPTYTQQDADMAFIATARNTLLGIIQAFEIVRDEHTRYKQALEEIRGMIYEFRGKPSPFSLGHASNRALYALDPTRDPLPASRRKTLQRNPCHHGRQCTGGGVNCGPSNT